MINSSIIFIVKLKPKASYPWTIAGAPGCWKLDQVPPKLKQQNTDACLSDRKNTHVCNKLQEAVVHCRNRDDGRSLHQWKFLLHTHKTKDFIINTFRFQQDSPFQYIIPFFFYFHYLQIIDIKCY